MNALLARLDHRHYAVLALVAWGAALLLLGLLRFDAYGIDEGATRALLLNWSVADQVAHPIVVFGMPDFRALLFIPLGLYWPGSIVAAKVLSILVAFAAIYLLHRWSARTQDDEVALLASGLALATPLILFQVDSVGAGPYLLLFLCAGVWIDAKYQAQQRMVSGWFFAHMLVVATLITLHPAGLAYALALAIKWGKQAGAGMRRKAVWIGLGATVTAIAAMQAGWIALAWFANPLPELATALFGLDPIDITPRHWSYGLPLAGIVAAVLVCDRHFLKSDLLGASLALACIIGLAAPDGTWATACVALALYRGIPCLIRANAALPGQGFLGQRGLVLAVLFTTLITFMQIDRAHAQRITMDVLPPTDELIRTLALTLEEAHAGEHTRVASQWPGRTMFATKHAALPLPPPQDDATKFLAQVKGLTHIMFAHNDPAYGPLARNIADIGGRTETIALQSGGVIVRFRSDAETAAGSATP